MAAVVQATYVLSVLPVFGIPRGGAEIQSPGRYGAEDGNLWDLLSRSHTSRAPSDRRSLDDNAILWPGRS